MKSNKDKYIGMRLSGDDYDLVKTLSYYHERNMSNLLIYLIKKEARELRLKGFRNENSYS